MINPPPLTGSLHFQTEAAPAALMRMGVWRGVHAHGVYCAWRALCIAWAQCGMSWWCCVARMLMSMSTGLRTRGWGLAGMQPGRARARALGYMRWS